MIKLTKSYMNNCASCNSSANISLVCGVNENNVYNKTISFCTDCFNELGVKINSFVPEVNNDKIFPEKFIKRVVDDDTKSNDDPVSGEYIPINNIPDDKCVDEGENVASPDNSVFESFECN